MKGWPAEETQGTNAPSASANLSHANSFYDTGAQARYFECHYGSEEVAMLGARDSIATIAVKNLKEARVHYEEKLGL